jgi:tetratricopeptide (TPR) repeat protein
VEKKADKMQKKIDALNAQAWELRFANTTQSLSYSVKAENLARKSDYRGGQVYALYLQAVCQNILSQYPVALQRLDLALSLCDDQICSKRRAEILNALGVAYQKTGRYDKSLAHLLEAEAMLSEDESPRQNAVVKTTSQTFTAI